MESTALVAFIAAGGAVLAAGLTGWFAYKSKNKTDEYTARQESRDREEKARVSEIEARASYVELMQRRVSELEGRIDGLNRIVGESRAEMGAQERRWRHFVNALIMYASICRLKSQEGGIDLPKFTGFARFEEEGGSLHESWYGHLGLEWSDRQREE